MKMKNVKAYTLLELLLIIGVMGIAAVVISPMFGSITKNWALEAEVRKVASRIREAQQMAITSQLNYGLLFDPTFECYEYGYYQSPAWINIERFCITNPEINLQGTTITTPASTVYFDHLGAPQSGILVTWRLRGTTQQLRLRVRSATGRVVVSRL